MRYQVFDNGKPADRHHNEYVRGDDWDTSTFDTLLEAQSRSGMMVGGIAQPAEAADLKSA